MEILAIRVRLPKAGLVLTVFVLYLGAKSRILPANLAKLGKKKTMPMRPRKISNKTKM